MRGLATGELGTSIAYDTPIAQLIAERLVVTVPLASLAMVLTTALALALGLFAAAAPRPRRRRRRDEREPGRHRAAELLVRDPPHLAVRGEAALVLRRRLSRLEHGDGGGAGPALRALVLPALALAVVQAAILARIVRSAVLDVLREDFVRTARAKGQSPRGVLWGHVLRNAMVPVLTVMGLQFANLLTGTVVIEQVFSLPGLGRLVFQAIANRDLPVVRNVVMLLAAMVVVINFIVDVLYVVIDPRLRARARTIVSGARAGRWRHANLRVGARARRARRRPARCSRTSGRRIRRPSSTSRTSCSRRARRTGSAPTASAATSHRSSSSAAASRSRSA